MAGIFAATCLIVVRYLPRGQVATDAGDVTAAVSE
jgi:hypothetical protein